MAQTMTKDNDYTLTIADSFLDKDGRPERPAYKATTITKTFNFLSAQVTTIVRNDVYSNYYSSNGVAHTAAVDSHVIRESFFDIPSNAEIKLAHAKLIEMEGKPPAFDEIFKDEGAKKPRVSSLGDSTPK